ncbi:MAG: PAS domain S-box protein [Flavobacteriaceae bacterium]|nr:PAS domain S-box protein [Flavobacteriaceae bacterium]
MPLFTTWEKVRSDIFDKIIHQETLQRVLDDVILHLNREFPKKIIGSVVLFENETSSIDAISAPGLPNVSLAKIRAILTEDEMAFWKPSSFNSDEICIEDAQKHPYWKLCKATFESESLDRSLTLPMRSKSNQLLGLMVVFFGENNALGEEELCFFKMLADILTNTVNNFHFVKQIEAHEYRYGLMFNGSPIPMFAFDLETLQFIDVNQSALDKYGYSRTEFLEKNLLDIRPEDERNKLLRFLKKESHRKHAVMEAGVWRHLKKNGELIYAQVSYQPVLIDNKLIGYVWINDITDQIQIQNTLSDQQKQLVNILDGIPEGVFMFTASGEIYDINPAGRQLLEIEDVFPIKNKLFVDFIEKSDREKFLKLLNIKKHRFKKTIEVALVSQTGTKRWIEIKVTPLHLHDDSFFLLAMVRDLTNEKYNMQMLSEQNKALIKTNKELDRFLYSTSHDLRSPLASILGILKIIETETLEPHTMNHAEMIKNRINRLDHLLKDILSLSVNKQHEIKPVCIDFRSLIDETINNLMHVETVVKIRFESDIDEATPFYSDLQRIRTITENLIGNAIKHHNPSEADPFVRVTLKTFSNRAVLSVEDNGIGIEKDLQKKIFDMFFRVSSRTDGNGIGLYLVKETAKNIGGSINVKSRPNEGSIFTVTLKNYRKHATY